MSERPILFSGPMVRALLAGTKTQTRRVLPTMVTGGMVEYPGKRDGRGYSRVNWLHTAEGMAAAVQECKHGQPGDRLWVRETHIDLGACALYRADADAERERALVAHGQKWRPSIHMPRAVSRITLEITRVRVERLQDISEADARAEGIPYSERFSGYCIGEAEHFHSHDPRESFWSLWQSINGAGSVQANPWVWVLDFKRVEDGDGRA